MSEKDHRARWRHSQNVSTIFFNLMVRVQVAVCGTGTFGIFVPDKRSDYGKMLEMFIAVRRFFKEGRQVLSGTGFTMTRIMFASSPQTALRHIINDAVDSDASGTPVFYRQTPAVVLRLN